HSAIRRKISHGNLARQKLSYIHERKARACKPLGLGINLVGMRAVADLEVIGPHRARHDRDLRTQSQARFGIARLDIHLMPDLTVLQGRDEGALTVIADSNKHRDDRPALAGKKIHDAASAAGRWRGPGRATNGNGSWRRHR